MEAALEIIAVITLVLFALGVRSAVRAGTDMAELDHLAFNVAPDPEEARPAWADASWHLSQTR